MARKPSASTGTRQARCAIYTRKSTEDGLEQEFNSLDAQREACAAYIQSQRHEGWVLAPGQYDDGGFSGGSMDRPGLKRLLAEVEAGRVDVIVVYKVDRLTRSLADFAKIVEILDAKGASFVSITQAFNTTTSMGRLTLNVLLSFAQFEREVTGERIRDKIAASKKKGMWMGGPVPLGYDVENRRLVPNGPEADLVGHIMQRYVALRSVRELIDELGRDGHRTKVQARTSGPHKGGCPFRRGTLYHLLSNRIYRGDIVHKGVAHPGEHEAIVTQALWDEVQGKLASRGPGGIIVKRNTERRSILAGLLHDGLGRAMQPSHASKGTKRYRYYVTRESSAEAPAWRVGAHDVERLVTEQISTLLLDSNRVARLVAAIEPRQIQQAVAAAATLATSEIFRTDLAAIGVERIDLNEDRIDIAIRERDLLSACNLSTDGKHDNRIMLGAPVERVRRGHEIRLVIPGDDTPCPASPARDERLAGLLAEAMEARALVLASPNLAIQEIASREGRCRKRLAKLVRLSWLAPDIVRDIVGGAKIVIGPAELLDLDLPVAWTDQRRAISTR